MVDKIIRLNKPPKIKILEALGALADNRVIIVNDKKAYVYSSDRNRKYTVYIDLENNAVYSDDNGTIYRNYIGYPIISVLMHKGILPYDRELASALRGIRWRFLNEKYKKYYIVERIVLNILNRKGFDTGKVMEYIDDVYRKISSLNLVKIDNIE